jgi:hypothetical protein
MGFFLRKNAFPNLNFATSGKALNFGLQLGLTVFINAAPFPPGVIIKRLQKSEFFGAHYLDNGIELDDEYFDLG